MPSAEKDNEELPFDRISEGTDQTDMEVSEGIEPKSDEAPFHNDYNVNLASIILKKISNFPFASQLENVGY